MRVINKLKDLYKKKSNLLNVLSIRAFSYPEKFIENIYKSKMLSISFTDHINIFFVKDTNINVQTNVVQKNNVVIDGFKRPILYETIKNNFYHNLLFSDKIHSLNKKSDLIINKKKNIYYFDVIDNKSNYYHFINDNLIPFLFFLENYKGDFQILYNSGIAQHINSYISLISKIYNKNTIKFKNKDNISIKNNLIIPTPMIYMKEGFFYKKNITEILSKKIIDPSFSIYKFPINFKFKNKKDLTVNNQYISKVLSSSQHKIVDKFIKRLISNKIIRAKKNKINLFIDRNDNSKNNLRTIYNKKNLINFLKENNFKIIKFENLSVAKQIEYTYNSNIIIAIHGANLANAIYKKKNTKIIELYPFQTNQNADFYKYMAEQRNLKYSRFLCRNINNTKIIVDINRLKKTLN